MDPEKDWGGKNNIIWAMVVEKDTWDWLERQKD